MSVTPDQAIATEGRAGVFEAAPLPLCAHCGLPVAGWHGEPGTLYCCGGCSLAHRITGGDGGHGRESGLLMAVGVGAFLAMNVMMLSFVLYAPGGEADRPAGEGWVRWALLLLSTPAMVLLGTPLLTRGGARLREGRLDTDVLVFIGVLAGWLFSAISVVSGRGPLYLDTAMGILLFVTIGRYIEASVRARATDALALLAKRLPREATRIGSGGDELVPIEALSAGDRVRIRPGERIAVDGRVVDGAAGVSEAELTGESLPVPRQAGDPVSAGTLCLDGTLVVEATRTGAATTLARLARIVEAARGGRTVLAPFVDRVSIVFVPVVLLLASGTFLFWSARSGVGTGLMNALSVLLIACPCAIGIAIPLASSAGVGRAAQAGVLVRSCSVFETLSRSRRVFLDKTGTLTTGHFEMVELATAAGVTEGELLALAAGLEEGSEHPLARSIRNEAAARGLVARRITGFRAVPGRGVEGHLSGDREPGGLARAGGQDFALGAPDLIRPGSSLVHVTLDDRWIGSIVFRDGLRPGAAGAIRSLRARGLAPEILSGDRAESVASFVQAFPGIEATAGLLPEEKLRRIAASAAGGEAPIMVGDGVNDAPALSGAGVGVTLESGTDLAREVSDVTILGGDLSKLPWLIALSDLTVRTARINLLWAFSYNVVGLVFAMAGMLHPLFGAVAMIASSLFGIAHSKRIGRFPLPAATP